MMMTMGELCCMKMGKQPICRAQSELQIVIRAVPRDLSGRIHPGSGDAHRLSGVINKVTTEVSGVHRSWC